jgi:hypothetical protein
MLDDLKESENGVFIGYGENNILGTPLCKSIDTTPQHRFDAPRAKHFESIMSICLDVTGFTKDNMNAGKDIAALCDHPLLEAKINARGGTE